MTRLPRGLWHVRSGTLWLAPDGLLTRFRDKAVALDYASAQEAKGDLRMRHQLSCCVRVEGTEGRGTIDEWLARNQA